jgi:hypothetical protein
MLAAALLCSCLARAVAGSVDPGVAIDLRAEARERTIANPGVPSSTFTEVELHPGLELGLAGTGVTFVLAFRPDLTFSSASDPAFSVLHRATLASTVALERGWDLTAAAFATYGPASTFQMASTGPSTPPGTPPPPAEPVPVVGQLDYVSGSAALGLAGALSPRLRLRSSAEVFLDGGANAAAQAQMPLERGARAGAGLDWTASPRDLLVSNLSASVTRLSTGRGALIARATEAWRYSATKNTELSAGAGLSYTSSRSQGQDINRVRPSGLLGLRWEARGPDTTFTTANAIATEPIVDRDTGIVVDRATASTTNTLALGRDWVAAVFASGGVSVDGPQAGESFWSAEARGTWTGGPSWQLYFGGRALWSRPNEAALRSFDWSVFVGLFLHQASRS